MKTWNRMARETTNNDELYRPFIERLGAEQINHVEIINFGDALDEEFLSNISIKKHIYKTGDSLSKIAHKNYGDVKYWWVLAWFNSRPTDFHCSPGDIIIIPSPLDIVLDQAYNIVDL